MSKKLVYDEAHMEEISGHYKQCAASIQLATTALGGIKKDFIANYKGQSNDISADLYAKLAEHMELLEACYTQMEAYVTYTKETMVEQDTGMADVVSGGGSR